VGSLCGSNSYRGIQILLLATEKQISIEMERHSRGFVRTQNNDETYGNAAINSEPLHRGAAKNKMAAVNNAIAFSRTVSR
jgi:hypothetical protein